MVMQVEQLYNQLTDTILDPNAMYEPKGNTLCGNGKLQQLLWLGGGRFLNRDLIRYKKRNEGYEMKKSTHETFHQPKRDT